MEQICLNIPDCIVALYRSINSSGLLSFFALMIALFIPFAIFIIDNGNRIDGEKDFARVERAVILNKVIHVKRLVTVTFLGGLASLLFIDNIHCNVTEIIFNFVMCVIIIVAIAMTMWTLINIIRWVTSSAKPDTVNSFCFKKWKKYLEGINDRDFFDIWNGVFKNNGLPSVLQPAYLSIFFDKVNNERPSEKYSILYENFENIDVYNPGVFEILINGIDLDNFGIILLNKIRDNCGLAGDFYLLMEYIDKKIQKDQDDKKSELIVKDFLFDGIKYYFEDEEKEREFVSAIPSSWKLSSLLLPEPQTMSKVMAIYYPRILQYLIDKQKEIDINLLDHINISLIGELGKFNIDERLLVDVCEIYGNLYIEDDRTLEQELIERYSKLDARRFSNLRMCTIIFGPNEKPNTKQLSKEQETNTLKVLAYIFPDHITDKSHISKMKREIRKQLKNSPDDYRLKKLLKIYNILFRHASSRGC